MNRRDVLQAGISMFIPPVGSKIEYLATYLLPPTRKTSYARVYMNTLNGLGSHGWIYFGELESDQDNKLLLFWRIK